MQAFVYFSVCPVIVCCHSPETPSTQQQRPRSMSWRSNAETILLLAASGQRQRSYSHGDDRQRKPSKEHHHHKENGQEVRHRHHHNQTQDGRPISRRSRTLSESTTSDNYALSTMESIIKKPTYPPLVEESTKQSTYL